MKFKNYTMIYKSIKNRIRLMNQKTRNNHSKTIYKTSNNKSQNSKNN